MGRKRAKDFMLGLNVIIVQLVVANSVCPCDHVLSVHFSLGLGEPGHPQLLGKL